MDSNAAAKQARPVDDRPAAADGWTIELSLDEAGARLSGRTSFIAVLLLSLALWAAIWAAVASVAQSMSG